MTSPGKDCVQPHPPAAKAAMAYEPSRGGVRGGKDQFDWDDVKVDKHRENYLGEYVSTTNKISLSPSPLLQSNGFAGNVALFCIDY